MSLLNNIVGPHVHGVLALGFGPFSFPSQASAFARGTFSYCIPAEAGLNASFRLVFGPQTGPAHTQCTELIPKVNGPFYAVNNCSEIGPEKWIVDTVQVYTSLPSGTYKAVVAPLDKWMSRFGRRVSPGMFSPLKYCYSVKSELHSWPKLDFVFGDGKVFKPVGPGVVVGLKSGVKCLGFVRSSDVLPVIGTIMQGNHWIQFRTGKSPKWCFAEANCTR
ncbi:eukaryotic aspartyl protease family protein [Striga asiatica]|uniref:Eukaryotic aspartyl protease family protein n=1 Tax=Striga asiatica TaxID=4170 RepID=A0A5A7QSB9_STRAF|nr:eukaryotic aspartyl protease family protein [Striga asiatica]